jgi:hypothetical protein
MRLVSEQITILLSRIFYVPFVACLALAGQVVLTAPWAAGAYVDPTHPDHDLHVFLQPSPSFIILSVVLNNPLKFILFIQ